MAIVTHGNKVTRPAFSQYARSTGKLELHNIVRHFFKCSSKFLFSLSLRWPLQCAGRNKKFTICSLRAVCIRPGGIDRQGGRSKNFYEMLLLKNNCTSPKTFFSIWIVSSVGESDWTAVFPSHLLWRAENPPFGINYSFILSVDSFQNSIPYTSFGWIGTVSSLENRLLTSRLKDFFWK